MAQNSSLVYQSTRPDNCRTAPTVIRESGCQGFGIEASLIVPELQSRDRMGAFKELVDRLYLTGNITDSLRFLQAVLDREDQQSTALGHGVALPHARCRSVAYPSLALGVSRTGITFPSDVHPEPVYVICMLAVPEAVPVQYLSLLGNLAFCFQRDSFRTELMACKTACEMYQVMAHRLSGFQHGPSTTADPFSCS